MKWGVVSFVFMVGAAVGWMGTYSNAGLTGVKPNLDINNVEKVTEALVEETESEQQPAVEVPTGQQNAGEVPSFRHGEYAVPSSDGASSFEDGTYANRETPCKTLADIYPGTVVTPKGSRPKWRPRKCTLAPFEQLPVKECFKGKHTVWLGDSLTRDVARKMTRFTQLGFGSKHEGHEKHWFTDGEKGPVYKNKEEIGQVYGHFYPIPGGGNFNYFWSAAALYDGSLNYTRTQSEIRKADTVFVGSGMWDMGVMFLHPDQYFDVMRARLETLRKMMKPGARLITFPVHWLHPDRCPVGRKCRLCNSGQKAGVFREALTMAAACVGAGVVDTAGITKEVPLATNDGAHYEKYVSLLQADVYLNAVCRKRPMDITPKLKCEPAKAKARWAKVAKANVGCHKR